MLVAGQPDLRLKSDRLNDPSLVRYYLFQEGKGGSVRQLAGNGEGELFLANNTLYGEPFPGTQRPKWHGIDPEFKGVTWGRGRFPGTHSIQPGNVANSVVHSRFYGDPKQGFSIEAWVRPRNGEGALIWAGDSRKGGFGLTDNGKKLTWRVATKTGVVSVDGAALPRGRWSQVVCVWDAETSSACLLYTSPSPRD